MDLENKKTEEAEKEIKDSRVAELEENELTSEYLKKTTKIGNCTWLSLFLLMLICGGVFIYWRFHMIFDSQTTKACLISSYDRGNDEYMKPLIKSIRFKLE